MNHHTHLPIAAYNEVTKIYYSALPSIADQHVIEIILINYYKPKYNQQDKKDDQLTAEYYYNIIDNINWKEYKENVKLPVYSDYTTREISVRKVGLSTFRKNELTSSEWSALGFYWYLLYRSNKLNNKVCYRNSNETSLTNVEMIRDTGISETSLKKYLKQLEDMGLIYRNGRGTGREIYINDDIVKLQQYRYSTHKC